MSKDLMHRNTPEEEEVDVKKADLSRLEGILATDELGLVTLRAELHTFEGLYYRVVGKKYAELDELHAQIAERLAKLRPKDTKAQSQAKEARKQAEESAEVAERIKEARPIKDFESNDRLKRLYRKLALLIHPDMTTDPREKERRHHIMAEINRAYEEGNEERLLRILEEWESSPDSVKGEGAGAELVRVIRKIAQVKRRLSEIKQEIEKLIQDENYQLKNKVEEAKMISRDLLKEMAEQIESQISEAKNQLNQMELRK